MRFQAQPIRFEYEFPDFVAQARAENGAVRLQEQPGLLVRGEYHRMGVEGATEQLHCRAFVLRKLEEALRLIEPEYGFVIFDAYRSRETQAGLFASYLSQIWARNPDWTEERVQAETRKFVAHPDEPSRFEVPPHLSGGALDLGLTFRGQVLDLGTPFDDLTERAATDFFEREFDPAFGLSKEDWVEYRERRRVLFHALRSVGFTNWPHEWWHFDLGNCVWAQVLGLPWIYGELKV